jgi:diguanylate cyclase (GGDEF)-like protein
VASVKNHLPPTAPVEPTALPVIKLLLQGIAVHSLKGDLADYHQFRAKMQKISDSLEEGQSFPEMELHAGSAVTSLRDYTQRNDKRRQQQTSESRAIIQLLMDTLEDLSIARPERMQQLKEIAGQLASATEAEELRAGKHQLSDCLTEVRKEAERQLADGRGDTVKDSITGLEARPAAEAALVQACASEVSCCAVILLVERIPLYNRRYGHEAGDQVLRFFAEFVKRTFEGQAVLFRWSGPALLLLMRGAMDKIQADVRKHVEPKLRCDLEIGSRNILLPIDVCWSVFSMMVDPRLLINKIDAFHSQ